MAARRRQLLPDEVVRELAELIQRAEALARRDQVRSFELRILMEDYPGKPASGTVMVRTRSGRWKQITRLPKR